MVTLIAEMLFDQRLGNHTLHSLPPDVARPVYDRAIQDVGIVHFGIGAFHRAHQAWYTDAAMNAGDRDWMVTGVSLRTPGVARKMNPQDGLYTLAERSDHATALRVVGSVRNVLVAGEDPLAVITAVAAPTTRIISFTVTERGYCRNEAGDLDFGRAHSLSFYFFVAQGLLRRRDAGLPGLTLIACDDIADNGGQLRKLILQYLERYEPDLANWFEDNCTCPSTMIDRMVPATTDDDCTMIAQTLGGLSDKACVVAEPFSQWLIEDRFAGPRPRWEAVGVQFVKDVSSHESVRSRMLGGALSALAYCGMKAGHVHMRDALDDRRLRRLAECLLTEEAAPTLSPDCRLNLAQYADTVMRRLSNTSLSYRLDQIATEASQQLPRRWLDTLAAHAAEGRTCPAILTALDAWIDHLGGSTGHVTDPFASRFCTMAANTPNPRDAAIAMLTGC